MPLEPSLHLHPGQRKGRPQFDPPPPALALAPPPPRLPLAPLAPLQPLGPVGRGRCPAGDVSTARRHSHLPPRALVSVASKRPGSE